MLTPSELLSVQALQTLLQTTPTLPPNLTADLTTCGHTLQHHPKQSAAALTRLLESLKTFPELHQTYQALRDNLQRNSNYARKGGDPTPIGDLPPEPTPQEVLNQMRDTCLSRGTAPPPPQSLWARLWGSSSPAS
jgi:hypothetical protein